MSEKAAKSTTTRSSSLTRNEIRRSKSKVRSYLRRCKEVITGHFNQESTIDHGLCSIASSSNEPVIQLQSVQQLNDSSFEVIVCEDKLLQQQNCSDLIPVNSITSDEVPTTITFNLDLGSDVSALKLTPAIWFYQNVKFAGLNFLRIIHFHIIDCVASIR